MKRFEAAWLPKGRRAFALLAVAALGLGVWVTTARLVAQQGGSSGSIAGMVTVDRGDVRALRVKARDTVHRIEYTVYTRNGRYEIFNLPASNYEVRAIEEAFESPMQAVDVKAGATQTANLALKFKEGWRAEEPAWDFLGARTARGPIAADDVALVAEAATGSATSKRVPKELVAFDTLYPPSPARDVMFKNGCFGCHSGGAYARATFHELGPRAEDGWRKGVKRMFELKQGRFELLPSGKYEPVASPVQSFDRVPEKDFESIVQYLTKNFGPDYKRTRDLKLDPLVRDENALASAIYIQYELNRTMGPAFSSGGRPSPTSHTVFASNDTPGVFWMSGLSDPSVLRVDTRDPNFTTRTKSYSAPHALNINTSMHGVVEDRGRAWFVEMSGNRVGEVDPTTGQVRTYPVVGSPHDISADSKGKLWFSYWSAKGKLGSIDPETKKITEYEFSKGSTGYGIDIDKQDRIWVVGLNTPAAFRFDQKTGKFKEYPVSLPPRRVTVDSKGKAWLAYYFGNMISMLDPDTGKNTEYTMPLKYGSPYEVRVDPADNLWIENSTYDSIVKFDQKTKQFTYFPFPELLAHTFKFTVDKQGTVAMSLGSPTKLTTFKEHGNVKK